MQPADIGRLVAAGHPRLSPDRRTVAFVVSRVDLDANCTRSAVWLVPVDGSRAAGPLTSGPHVDGEPTWSPDGTTLAFTRTPAGGGPSQLLVLPVTGPGEARAVAERAEAITGVAWSPDGHLLAFTSRQRDEASGDPRRQPPRRITRFFSRLDDVGWTVDRARHVHVVAVDGLTPVRDLTPGEFEFDHASWLPDGSGLVATGQAHDTWDLDLARDLYRLPLDGPPEDLTHQRGRFDQPSPSPDGTRVAFLGTDGPAIEPLNAKVGVLDLATGEHTWLTGALDRTCAPYPGARAPVWDGERLLFTIEDRGRVPLYEVAPGGVPSPAVTGERCITGWDARGDVVVCAVTTSDRPAEVVVVTPAGERRLTAAADAFVATTRPQRAQHFLAPSSGGAEVDAWIVLPPDLDTTRRYPVLLNVHGGPFTQTGERFFDEAQLQAAAGFAAVLSNPRGSSGREQAWGRAIAGPLDPHDPGTGWGSVDVDDVLAVLDVALRRFPFLDPDRVGVLGGSYGGYLTSWLVGRTHRFRAACSERAVNNLLTLEWTSDIATAFRTEIGVTHLDEPGEYVRMSPITYVREIETPLLILHSEDDLRCPISQAEELFVALRMLGKEVELYRFPAESHELSRSGSPVHRQQRAEIILEFFRRHLQP